MEEIEKRLKDSKFCLEILGSGYQSIAITVKDDVLKDIDLKSPVLIITKEKEKNVV